MFEPNTFKLLDMLVAVPKGNGSRAAKIKILTDGKKYLEEYMDIAFNPYRVFGIAKLPKKSTVGLHLEDGLHFRDLIVGLENKKGPKSNADKQLARNVINGYPQPWYKHLESALLKNVKIGIDAKTLVKAGYNIPIFDCLLAVPNKQSSLEGITYPCYVQKKEDGCRMIRMSDGTCFGRNGKPVNNPNVNNYIQVAPPHRNLVLDGEFVSPIRSLQEINGIFRHETKEIPKDIQFVIFSVMTQEEWDKQDAPMTFKEQLVLLQEVAEAGTNLAAIESPIAGSESEAREIYQHYLDRGFEGAMVKNINAKYMWKRVGFHDSVMVKLKPEEEIDGKVVGFYKGDEKGRHKDSLGGMVVLLEDGRKTNVGGGYSDELRNKIWNNQEEYLNQYN